MSPAPKAQESQSRRGFSCRARSFFLGYPHVGVATMRTIRDKWVVGVGNDSRSSRCKSHPRPKSGNRTIRDRNHSVETGCAAKSSHQGSEWPVLVKQQETFNA
jgi:hypothetical protein